MTTTDQLADAIQGFNLTSNSKPVGYLRFAHRGKYWRCNRLHGDGTMCFTTHDTLQEALDCTEMHHESEPETT